LINELRIIDNISVLLDNEIVLYGAGYQGVRTLKKLKEAGVPTSYFCDSDPKKWNTAVEDVEILSPLELKHLDSLKNLTIIITTDKVRFIDEIEEDLKWLSLRTDNISTLFALDISLELNKLTSRINNGYYNTILNIRRKLFFLSWAAQHLEMFESWTEKDNLLLIYSLSKTGTSTVQHSLHEANAIVDHFHRLFFDPYPFLGELKDKYRQNTIDILRTRKSIKVICLMREPISRIISQIFQIVANREITFGDMQKGKLLVDSLTETIMFKKWIKSELNPMFESLNWFDTELKQVFGIDVYAQPFDRENGYSVTKQGNVEVLMMKLEKLNSLEHVIAEFVGLSRFKLVNDNEGDNKPSKYLYKQVRDAVKLPHEVLDSYYKDSRMQHFYNEEEIAAFYDKWLKQV
jgi:hypothetical protein